MSYLLSFLEGVITFISPCMLPMLPIYVSYFSGGAGGGGKRTLGNALGFVLGFSLVFVAMGAFAGSVGQLLLRYSTWVNLVGGAVIVLLGLSYMGIIRIPSFSGSRGAQMAPEKLRSLRFATSVLFGIIFSVGWTPCVGAFLGSALTLAATSGHVWGGTLMLVCYSAGLGIPFILSAVLLDQLQSAFSFIKKHYRVINLICGGLLVMTGLAMMTGLLGRLLGLLSLRV